MIYYVKEAIREFDRQPGHDILPKVPYKEFRMKIFAWLAAVFLAFGLFGYAFTASAASDLGFELASDLYEYCPVKYGFFSVPDFRGGNSAEKSWVCLTGPTRTGVREVDFEDMCVWKLGPGASYEVVFQAGTRQIKCKS